MFPEEKIDAIKQKFSSSDFKVPFTTGSDILKSIEAAFININGSEGSLNSYSQRLDWANNIKDRIECQTVSLNNKNTWLQKLDSNKNFWVVITIGSSMVEKYLVYDCKPNALIVLVSMIGTDFFVVDKKYKWFSYFQIDSQTNMATIFRSGNNDTPFHP